MKDKESIIHKRKWLFIKQFLRPDSALVTEEEVEYFSQHPEEIDDFSAPLNLHRLFLILGAVLGVVLVGLSKVIKFSVSPTFFSEAMLEFIVDLTFEIGTALLGAALTAWLLGLLLKQQQSDAKRWRTELHKQIKARKRSTSATPP